jgi:hypothetical protein
VNAANGVNHVLRRSAFREITRSASLHHFGGQGVFGVNGKHDDFCVGTAARDFTRRFKAADTGHIHIHENNINRIGTTPFNGVFTAVDLTRHFYALNIFENASYPCAHQFMVINK